MARKTSRQAEEESHQDADLLPHLRHHGHDHRRRHRLVRAAFMVPEWGEACFSLTVSLYLVWDDTTKVMMHRMDMGVHRLHFVRC